MQNQQSNISRQHAMVLVGTVSVTALAWFVYRHITQIQQSSPQRKLSDAGRVDTKPSFVDLIKQQNRKVIIFYGSQTGTAEGFAERLSKDCRKVGVNAVAMNLEECDMRALDAVPADCLTAFLLATYGEGEPTDNTVAFWDLLHEETPVFSNGYCDKPLKNLRYFIFGLGNSTYSQFNHSARVIDERLSCLGGTRLGQRGEGDDNDDLERDFENWRNSVRDIFYKEVEATRDTAQVDDVSNAFTTYKVQELESCADKIYYGELGDGSVGVWGMKNPYPATVLAIRDLTSGLDRHCLHLEIDIASSGLSYQTGDHLAIWPINPDKEIHRFARVFGLSEKLETVIRVEATDATATKRSPFPSPTTYLAALRHYLELCALPSRKTLEALIPYFKNPDLITTLSTDKNAYQTNVVDAARNLAEVVEYVTETSGCPAPNVPFDVLLDCLIRLQPRYYSISSSSSESPAVISATVVTLQYNPTPDRTFCGVNTNYLWAVHNSTKGLVTDIAYAVQGPHNSYLCEKTAKIPVHVRASTFRLPQDASKPIIMIGPGTGVAPFRGFVRERVYQKQKGANVGTTILFFGCRRSDEDFLYKDEWPELFVALGRPSRMFAAFSRETSTKVYVQDRLRENGKEMWDLIDIRGAYVYVCGDAKRMAKDVYDTLLGFATSHGNHSNAEAIEYMFRLKREGRYQEDVWT